MPTFDTAQELLQPGETGLFVLTDGRHFAINPDGSGSTGGRERVEGGPDGPVTLADLFAGRSQLIVYHFMFAPEWEAGCKSCSFWADNFNGVTDHLTQRDTSFAAISRAPVSKLLAHRKRLGWSFTWVSSQNNRFNYDFGVAFTPDELAKGASYNYGSFQPKATDMPGVSVFIKEGDSIFHTYSTFGRGIDLMNTAYNYLDLVPKGRDENGRPMSWLKYRDEYTR